MGSGSLALLTRDAPASMPGPAPLAGPAAQRLRIVDGLLECIGRHGLAKTTLDDVARAAGCSRATVYRAFPGGKEALLAAAVDTELSRLFSDLAVRMGAADDLEAVLVAGITGAARRITGHRALAFLLEHEPEVVLPQLAFDHHDRLLRVVGSYAAPFLGRWLDHDEAERVAEWATRIVLSYLGTPAVGIELTDDADVRRLVRTYVLPGVRVMSEELDAAAATGASTSSARTRIDQTSIAQTKGEAS